MELGFGVVKQAPQARLRDKAAEQHQTSIRRSEICQPNIMFSLGVANLCAFELNRSTQDRYSTARVSKRPADESAACLRARYCTGAPMLLGLIYFNPEENM